MQNRVKVRMLLVAFAMFLAIGVTRDSLAFYTVTGTATNVVTSGNVAFKIHEKTEDGQPFPVEGVTVKAGDVVHKEVTVENTCAQPFYLRIKLVNGIEQSQLSVKDVFNIDLDTTDWTYHEGYIYYNAILQPGQTTPAAFTQVEIVKSAVSEHYAGHTLTLTVTAQAVQSKNNPAAHPWEALGWPTEEGGQA